MNKAGKTEGTRKTKRANAKGKTTKSSKNNGSQLLYDEPANGPTFQRKRMETEKAQLLVTADGWSQVMESGVPSYAGEEICAIVGQTRLLTSSKFDQFAGLVDNAEKQLRSDNEGPAKITCNDLDGFWDMMYLQVQQLKEKYRRLEELKENNWRRDVDRKAKTNVQPTNKPPTKYNAVSRIKDAIRAKRMAMKNKETDKENNGDVLMSGRREEERPTTSASDVTNGDGKMAVESEDAEASISVINGRQTPRDDYKSDSKRKAVSKSKTLKNRNSEDSRLETVEEATQLRRSARIAEKQNISKKNETDESARNTTKPRNFAEVNRLKAEKFKRSSFGTVGLLTSRIGKAVVSSPRN